MDFSHGFLLEHEQNSMTLQKNGFLERGFIHMFQKHISKNFTKQTAWSEKNAGFLIQSWSQSGKRNYKFTN